MNRAQFFDVVRREFGAMAVETVAGIEALLDAGRDLPLHHMANVLAQVRRETGGWMAPIKETVMPWHKNKAPSDKEVIRRLDAAWKAGKLKGVKAPYWQDGEFGRGQIQLTHAANRAKFGISNRDDLLRPHISAMVAVRGMVEGRFRGKKLADYAFPGDLRNPPATNPRRIVNGNDGSDAEVAASHILFAAALKAGGWGVGPAVDTPLSPTPVVASKAPDPVAKPIVDQKPPVSAPQTPTGWAAIIAAILRLFKGGK